MELECELSTLEISNKKRRLSDFFDSSDSSPEQPSPSKCSQPTEENMELLKDSAPRRSSRKKTSTSFWDATLADIKPTTTPVSLCLENDYKEIEKLYLCKTIKKMNTSLETIFEDPQNNRVMSGRKFKRSMNFDKNVVCYRNKVKKRILKAKKVTKQLTKSKIDMAVLMCKLADIEKDEN